MMLTNIIWLTPVQMWMKRTAQKKTQRVFLKLSLTLFHLLFSRSVIKFPQNVEVSLFLFSVSVRSSVLY